jgi:hypothetical protein
MAVIAPVVVTLNNATVKVGTSNFETSISSVALVPTSTVNTFKGVGGNTIASNATPEWVANITFVQDFATAGSFSNMLLNNAGTDIVMDFYVKVGGPGYRATVRLVPGQIGGDVDDQLTASVTLAVSGQPALITP